MFCSLLRQSRNRAAVIMECVSRLYLFFFPGLHRDSIAWGRGDRVIERARGDGRPPCFKAGALTSSSVMYKPGYSSPELLQQGKRLTLQLVCALEGPLVPVYNVPDPVGWRGCGKEVQTGKYRLRKFAFYFLHVKKMLLLLSICWGGDNSI